MSANLNSLSMLSLGVILTLLLSTVAAQAEVEWHSAADFEIEGRGWTDTEAPFDRLPAHAKGRAPEGVWYLSKHSAGECVRFRSDAPTVSVRWSVLNAELAMPHMPATGVSGVDLYRKEADGRWRFVQNGRPTAAKDNRLEHATGAGGKMQDYLLYLPLYNGVRSLEIGVEKGARLQRAAARPAGHDRPAVFYGTSITQGGCASRPGMAFVAILGRHLDLPTINLGFSGSGKMEPEMATLLAELDPALFVIDCMANMGGLPDAEIEKRVTHLARTIRKARPQTPILFVAQASIRPERLPFANSRAQERAVRKLMAEGVPGLHLMEAKSLLGTDTEGTVDGVHPNDLGMMRHAEAFIPIVKTLLKPSGTE